MKDSFSERVTPIEETPFQFKRPKPEEEISFVQGGETDTADIIVETKKEGKRVREFKGTFILKKCNIWGLTPEQKDSETTSSYEKLMKLKEINAIQRLKGEHQFNLPITIRLVKDHDGSLAILETNIMAGKSEKKLDFIDLKYADEWDFDEDTHKLIVDTIRADFDLAAKYNVNLSVMMNTWRPLDTWCLVRDLDTNDKKLYILDVGSSVKLNDSSEDIEESRMKIYKATDSLHVGESIKRVPGRAKPDLEEEESGTAGDYRIGPFEW